MNGPDKVKRSILCLSILAVLFPILGRGETTVNGVRVLDTLEELVDPGKTAIIVVDIQNDWASTEGTSHRADKNAKADPAKHKITPQFSEQVRNMKKLLDAAREAGVQIAYAEFIHKRKYSRMRYGNLARRGRPRILRSLCEGLRGPA